MPAFSTTAIPGVGHPPLLALVLPQLCLAVVLLVLASSRLSRHSHLQTKLPRLCCLLPWQPPGAAPLLPFRCTRKLVWGSLFIPSVALSCLPLEHNVSLDLKLAGKSWAIFPWERPKTPRKCSRLETTLLWASVVLGAKADGGSWMQEELLGLKEAPAWFPELPRLINELSAGGLVIK